MKTCHRQTWAPELSDERAHCREREKSFVRHTHFVMNYHTHATCSVEKKAFLDPTAAGIAPYLALTIWNSDQAGMKTHRTHPSIHPYAVSSPRKRCLHSQFQKRCAREKTRKGRNMGKENPGTNPHTDSERGRNRASREKFYLDKSSSTNDFILFT